METNRPFGLYLYKKERKDLHVLKELLQFLKTNVGKQSPSFAYVEAQTSLIPHVSLWENLQIELGKGDWKEFSEGLKPEWQPLVRTLRNPHALTREAEAWEKLSVSLLKGLLNPAQNLLIDMNEDLLSPLILKNLKSTLLQVTSTKQIYLASAHHPLWLDCAHSLVSRQSYEFIVEKLDQETIKRHWAA